ncbi:hypothetical protein G3I13_01765 [Streptomyces sp. SID6673]|nr:hypothetical protein [Streptomyces sp. SID11726]NDZ94888.1 hypothetical protein [Streptomyces sp. SID11726]NEB23048.1 hypothetical protein [Streptomyces sp. SID6673]
MERGKDRPRPLEHDDPHRLERIKQVAPHLVFEHLMQDADEGKMTREEAIERCRALRPLLVEGGVLYVRDEEGEG